jgi:shikimate kinase
MITKPIVLTGMMGSGKSVLGKALAKKLGLPFIDADAEIERQENASIAAIFTEHGEERFRKIEENVLRKLLAGPVAVIAAGGGAIINQHTRLLFREQALAVWLKAPVATLFERTKGDATRPLLKNGDPLATLSRLLTERERFYAEAAIHLDTSAASFNETVEELAAKVQDALR